MDRPDTPFPRHWLYYIVLKIVLIAARCVALKYSTSGDAMTRERLYLFDTTLRDGAQMNGVDFTLHDKLTIAKLLDDLGIDYVEGGYPGANPTDTELFCAGPQAGRDVHGLRHDAAARPLGLERSRPRGAARRQGRRDLLRGEVVGLSRACRARDDRTRKTSPRSATACRPPGKRAARCWSTASISSTATRPIRTYALACAKAAHEAGARWVVLCDTNGGTLPHEVEAIVGEVVKHVPGDHVGIHAHNDTEQAVANSLAAVRAGARQIQGTLNGLGERCGNANLVSIIPTLKLKPEFAEKFDIAISDEKLKTLAHASRTLDEMLNRAPNRHAPYVGESAFATKAGIHASAIVKDPATYEHVAARPGRQPAQDPGVRSGRPLERAVRAGTHRPHRRQERSARHAPARRGEGARGAGLCLRGGGRVVRTAGAAHARPRAGLFRGREVRRQRRAAHQCGRPARHRLDGGGQGEGRRRDA